MTEKTPKPNKNQPKDAREARLAAALRANLRRRKVAKKNSNRIQTDSPENTGDEVE